MRGITTKKLALGICLAAVFSLNATELFSDSSFAASSTKWYTPNIPGVTLSRANASMAVNNTNLGFCTYYTNSIFNPPAFTFSGKIKSNNKNLYSGFALCMSTNYTGYYLTLDTSKNCIFIKNLGTNSPRTLAYIPASQLSGDDIFTVSHRDSTWKISINGILSKTFVDTSFKSGRIGLIAGPKSNIEFDNISLTDVYTAPAERTAYVDSFPSSASVNNWYYFASNEPRSVSGNQLTLTNSSEYTQSAIITGSFDSSYIKAILSTPGTAIRDEAYGVGFYRCDYDSPAINLRTFALIINKRGLIGFVKPDTTGFQLSNAFGLYTHASEDGQDTLEMICDKSNHQFKFKINGQELGTATNIPNVHFEGAGIFVQSPDVGKSPMVVNVQKFIVAPDSSAHWLAAGPMVRFFDKRTFQKVTIARAQIVYNIRGQRIMRMNIPTHGIFVITGKNTTASKALQVQ